MNWAQIKYLFKINLLYANPQYTQKIRKNKSSQKIFRSLLIQNGFSGLIFLLIYGFMMLMIDFPKYPGYFTFYLAMFTLLSFSQTTSSLHNIFYESKDFKDYLPLPFSNKTIFFSKFLTVGFISLSFLLPLLALFVIAGFRAMGLLGVLPALVSFLLFSFIFLSLSLILISSIVQSKLFQKYKKTATGLLVAIPIVGSIAGVLYMNMQNSQMDAFIDGKIADKAVIHILLPAYYATVKLFSISGLFSLAGGLLLAYLIFIFISKKTIPKMFLLLTGKNTNQISPVKPKKANQSTSFNSLNKQLFNYNINLLKNPNLWVQSLTASLMFPLILFISFFSNGSKNGLHVILSSLDLRFFSVFMTVGIFIALLTSGSNTLIAIFISLDRENFNFIKSLPIDLGSYLKQKFRLGFSIQWILNLLTLFVAWFAFKFSLILFIALFIGNFIGLYLASTHYFARDWKLLNLNWTALTQLYQRGTGSFAIFINLMANMIIFVILIGGNIALILFLPHQLLTNLAIIAILSFIGIVLFTYQRSNFWKKFK